VPTQPTTVVTTPRPTPTTTTVPPFELPETGADHWGLLAIGATAFAVGVALRRLVERS
jgi:LPXTG-motif cell wall-anchored protein